LKSCLNFYRSTFVWFALVLKAAVTDTVEVLAWLVCRGFLKMVLFDLFADARAKSLRRSIGRAGSERRR
jgi:hypothetical protein